MCTIASTCYMSHICTFLLFAWFSVGMMCILLPTTLTRALLGKRGGQNLLPLQFFVNTSKSVTPGTSNLQYLTVRMRNRVPRDTKRMLIEALVLPHIQYCISVWGSCSVSQKRCIQKTINFGARVVSGLNRQEHIIPVLNKLGWKSVEDMIRASDIAIIRHLLTTDDPPEILRSKLVLRSDESSRRTRATDKGQLQLPRVKSEFA